MRWWSCSLKLGWIKASSPESMHLMQHDHSLEHIFVANMVTTWKGVSHSLKSWSVEVIKWSERGCARVWTSHAEHTLNVLNTRTPLHFTTHFILNHDMPLATRIINHEGIQILPCLVRLLKIHCYWIRNLEALSIETTTIEGLESDLQFFTLPITFTIHCKNPSGEILKRGMDFGRFMLRRNNDLF